MKQGYLPTPRPRIIGILTTLKTNDGKICANSFRSFFDFYFSVLDGLQRIWAAYMNAIFIRTFYVF